MKRFFVLIIALAVLISAAGCWLDTRQEQVLSSLGRWDEKKFYTSGGFQDFTDFGTYTFSDADPAKSPYFALLTEGDAETLSAFLDNFEDWIDSIRRSEPQNEVVVHYAFDRGLMDTQDYFYIYEDPDYPKYGCYDVWFFDSQTNVLYYFHSNI